MIRPCRSAKWLGREPPALGAEEVAARPCRARARAPRARPARRRRASAAATSRPTPTAVPTAEPEDRLAQHRVVAAGEHEEPDVGDAHGAVGAGEERAPCRRTRPGRRARRRATRPSRRRRRAAQRPPRDRPRWSATRSRPTTTRARRARQALGEPVPRRLGAISAVHWVIASTKTRSKKSSSGVTRSSWRRTAEKRRDETVVTLTQRLSQSRSSGRRRRAGRSNTQRARRRRRRTPRGRPTGSARRGRAG